MPAPTSTAPAVVSTVPVVVTGTLVRRGQAIEICPGRSVAACPGIRVVGKVEDAWLSEDDTLNVFRVTGSFDGTTLTVDRPAERFALTDEPGQARFSEAELEHERKLADTVLAQRGIVQSSSGSYVAVNRIVYELEAIDAQTRALLARYAGDAVVVVPFIELLKHSLAQMPAAAPRGHVPLITSPYRSGGERTALGRFSAHYDPVLLCVYLLDPEGKRFLPGWPFGYWATSNPLRIYDSDDNLVAQAGETHNYVGGWMDVEQIHATNNCGAEHAWAGRPYDEETTLSR